MTYARGLLSFHPNHGKYVKTFPLHNSQKIINDSTKELRISLLLHITFDFIQELLYHGSFVEVISPPELKKELCKQYAKALRHYDKKKKGYLPAKN